MYFHLLNKNLKDYKKAKPKEKHLVIDIAKNEIKFTEKPKKEKDLRH